MAADPEDPIPDDNTDVDFGGLTCPVPLQDYPNIILGHGAGGKLSSELIEHVFLPAFENPHLAKLSDAAVFSVDSGRFAFTTDSYVVQPLFFPGGCIGDLAVNGTVNDLAMSGAKPIHLSAGFIIEEGFPVAQLKVIADEMGAAAANAGVTIVTGDTKIVEKGHGDGCYINTSGVGIVPNGVNIAPQLAKPGDAIIVSGTIGDHGMAIMSVREGLEFESEIRSDSAALNQLVADIVDVCPDLHVLRDPTRGGVAACLNEIAVASNCGIVLEESQIPINPAVRSACEILGFDPLQVANEGKLLCFIASESTESVMSAMRSNLLGKDAAIIGHVVAERRKTVVAKTAIGATRMITLPLGEQLPRIC